MTVRGSWQRWSEILRFAQNDSSDVWFLVMLSKAKHL